MSQAQPTPSALRLYELLADRATEGLGEPEDRIVTELLAQHPDVDPECMDQAAALADLAFMLEEPEPEALPADLEKRLIEQARFAAAEASAASPEEETRADWRGQLGWWAAAAALVLAVIGWMPGDEGSGVTLGAAARRTNLIASATDLVRAQWKGLDDPRFAGVSGDVVWSPERQEGYMLLRNLPANDPRKVQYQLWIVDPNVDKHPVDGGVFDVSPGQTEVVIPIDSKLGVQNAQAFVLTEEHPGGVVVSDGPHLVLAKP